MISVDFTPITLKKPTDPRTDSMTSTTPERPSNTWHSTIHNYNDINNVSILNLEKLTLNFFFLNKHNFPVRRNKMKIIETIP